MRRNLGGLLMFVGDVAVVEMRCRRAAEAGNSNGERNLALILDPREQNENRTRVEGGPERVP